MGYIILCCDSRVDENIEVDNVMICVETIKHSVVVLQII